MSAISTHLPAAPVTRLGRPRLGARRSGCPCCGSARVSRLDLSLTDGTPVVFTTCRGCERRSYAGPDGDLAVLDVLTRTVKPGKGRIPERATA